MNILIHPCTNIQHKDTVRLVGLAIFTPTRGPVTLLATDTLQYSVIFPTNFPLSEDNLSAHTSTKRVNLNNYNCIRVLEI